MTKRDFLYGKRYYIVIISLALLYFLAGIVSLLLLNGHKIVNIGMFASEGIALAFVLYFGRKVWPGIYIGQLTLALYNNIPLIPSLEISAISSIEAIVAYTIFEAFGFNIRLRTFRDALGLTFVILFVLQVISAVFSNVALLVHSQIRGDEFFNSIFSWWFVNSIGQLLFAPFVLILLLDHKKINFIKYIIFGSIFGILLYIVEIVFAIKSILLIQSLTITITIYIVSKKGMAYGLLICILTAIISALSVYYGKGAFYVGLDVDNAINYYLFVLTHIVVVFIVGILFEQKRDIERSLKERIEKEIAKNKEQQLMMIQQSRLAQMGEMIAMIAHQWRQPLNNLALANQFLVSKYKKNTLDDKAMEYFRENSKKQIDLMSTTIDDFRNFFKVEKKGQIFCINYVVENILSMTKQIYKEKSIDIFFDTKEHFYVYGYPNDFGQTILNIVNNAKDALLESDVDNKTIKITIYRNDDNVIVSIADNAGGVPNEIKDKIFDPYFTTKDSKNGTGLGLYMTKMIIKEKLKGDIFVENINGGANFKIVLKEEKRSA